MRLQVETDPQDADLAPNRDFDDQKTAVRRPSAAAQDQDVPLLDVSKSAEFRPRYRRSPRLKLVVGDFRSTVRLAAAAETGLAG